MRRPLLFMLLLTLQGCGLLEFDRYDYETQRDAHFEIKGMDAEVQKVRGGLIFGKKIKLGTPPPPASSQPDAKPRKDPEGEN